MLLLAPQIIYEDADLLVINKPAGMVVNRSATVREGETLQDWLEKSVLRRELSGRPGLSEGQAFREEDFLARSGIVHRLDKDTSGVLVVAKNPPAFSDLQRQFKERLVRKTYIALVHGWFSRRPGLQEGQASGEIRASLGRDPKNRQRFAVTADGRPATTKYRVLEYYDRHSGRRPESDPGRARMTYTLLELQPLTGRTHQIRVHLAHLHHPVVTDPWYAGRKTSRGDRLFCPRLFLHAQSLGFAHPRTGVWLKVEADLPDDLKKVLQSLQTTPLTP